MVIRLDENYNAMTSTALLGYVGETNARPVSVEGLTVDGADRYVLTIDYGDGVQYEVDITGGQWTPTADILRSAQTVSCQIAAKKLSGDEYILVKKSRIFRLRIGAAIGDNAVPSPDVAMDALDRIDAIGRQAHADMQTAVTAAETATTAAENAKKSATNAGVSADTAEQAASRAETAKTAAETSAAQSETARQGAENARQQAVKSQNDAKVSAAQASTAAQQTEADKTITAGYAKTAKTAADSTTADRQAVQTLAEQVTADKATVADHAAQVAEDRKTAETAAQTAQSIADSLPDDYVTAVGKIAENTADISAVKLTDKELQRRVNALFDIGQGVTHRFETDTDTAYQKTIPTGAKLMSVKSVGGRSIVWNQLCDTVLDNFSDTVSAVYHEYGICKFTANVGDKICIYSGGINGTYAANGAYVAGFIGSAYIEFFGKQIVQCTENGNCIIYLRLRGDGNTYSNVSVRPEFFNLTKMFGAGNEPTTVEEFEAMFPEDYYPYNAGEIVSAGVTEVEYGLFGRNLYNHSELKKNGYVKFHVVGGRQLYRSNTLGRTVEWTLFSKTGTKIGTFEDLNFKSGTAFNLPDNADYIISIDTYSANAKTYIGYNPDTTYVPYDDGLIAYPIPEAIRNLPGYGIEGNVTDYETKTYTQNNIIDGTEVKALDTPIVTDISALIPDDFLRNVEVEAGGSVIFKNSNDSYLIPVPSEEEYIVKLSEVGGTT
nr:MAG TPA: L SHAPED TAIL FIBER PROTEIN [Caudoviricetes sp.]